MLEHCLLTSLSPLARSNCSVTVSSCFKSSRLHVVSTLGKLGESQQQQKLMEDGCK